LASVEGCLNDRDLSLELSWVGSTDQGRQAGACGWVEHSDHQQKGKSDAQLEAAPRGNGEKFNQSHQRGQTYELKVNHLRIVGYPHADESQSRNHDKELEEDK